MKAKWGTLSEGNSGYREGWQPLPSCQCWVQPRRAAEIFCVFNRRRTLCDEAHDETPPAAWCWRFGCSRVPRNPPPPRKTTSLCSWALWVALWVARWGWCVSAARWPGLCWEDSAAVTCPLFSVTSHPPPGSLGQCFGCSFDTAGRRLPHSLHACSAFCPEPP